MKILIIEDEIRIGNLLKLYLERESFQVVYVPNGDTGLERALCEHFDLIILDVLMPGKDGFTVLEELRKIKTTPTFMLSAKCTEEDMKRGFDLGANDFIAKPFSPGMVVAKIKDILSISS